MANYKLYLAQVPEENQKRVRHCLKRLLSSLRGAESRLVGYESDDAEATTCSVIKTIQNLKETIAMAEGMVTELIDAHGLPEDLKHISDQFRKDFRKVLTGESAG
jgi:hypothetical protein